MAVLSAVVCAMPLSGQTTPATAAFAPYTTCVFPDGLTVASVDPLAPGITTRPVKTAKEFKSVTMLDGRRVMFAYPGEDFYANVKVETLPAASWNESRAALVDNFDYLLASGDDERNYKLHPLMNGFAIQGQDRPRREGGVLGLYLLFDDGTHTVTTIYFLNQEPPLRFKTMDEYAALRDRFLTSYTGCIRKALGTR